MVEFRDKLWIFGGYGENDNLTLHFEVFNGTTWSIGGAMPNADTRYGPCAIVYDEKLYLVGGNDGTYTGDTFRFGAKLF